MLLQQSGPVLAANSVGAVLTGVDEPIYTIQPQASILTAGISGANAASSQLLFSFTDSTECVIAEESDGQQQETMTSQSEVVTAVGVESVAVSDLVGTSEVANKTSVPDIHSGELHYSSHSEYSSNPLEVNRINTDSHLDSPNKVLNAEAPE